MNVRAIPSCCRPSRGPIVTCTLSIPSTTNPVDHRNVYSRRLQLFRLSVLYPHSESSSFGNTWPWSNETPGLEFTSRRFLLIAGSVLPASFFTLPSHAEQAQNEELAARFVNQRLGYALDRPVNFQQVEKAGADVLFRDPDRKSTTIGVTVSPIKIESLAEFGDVKFVGDKLLNAEKNKDGYISVVMLSEGSRNSSDGTLIYDFEYELNSTRGQKRILSSVAVRNRMLYIMNTAFKCNKEVGCEAAEHAIDELRKANQSFSFL